MRRVTGAILILFFVASPAFGQLTELIVDGSSMNGERIADVSISPDGVIQVTTVNGNYEIREKTVAIGDVVINSFSINNVSNAMLDVNDSATLRWGTSDADSCSASTTSVKPLNDWDITTTLGVQGPARVSFPVAGIYNLRLDCVGTNGSNDSKIVTAQVGSANITSFEVTPSSAETGADVTLTLTWSSENTEILGCSGSDNWPGSWKLPSSGTRTIEINDIQADTAFELTCFSAFDEDSSTFAINVTEPSVANCSAPPLKKATNRVWTQVFKEAWPGPKSEQVRLSVPEKGYYSVKFNTGNVSDDGFFTNIEASGTIGYRLGAVSECPGDFDVQDECQHKWGSNGGIFWDTEGGAGKCKLKANTTYYWNLTFTDGVDPKSSRCIGSYCETYFQVSNR